MKKTTFAALLCAPAMAAAQGPDVAGQVKLLVERESGGSNRVEVTVGAPSSRMQLDACERMEPFIPRGARLWGRTMLGMRCTEGATWQAFMPVQIRVFGTAPVAARALTAGESVTEADVRMEEVELSAYPAGSMADVGQIAGKQLVRPVTPGQPLQASWFRAKLVISQGDTVKVVYAGTGFSIMADGRALTQGYEGQSVRVAMESGRTVTGTARPDRVVELKY